MAYAACRQGKQRIGDLVWAAGDIRAKGFIVGATAGRTTLAGEGHQHQDGHNLLWAQAVPTLRVYDPAYAYELAVSIQDGIHRMCEKHGKRIAQQGGKLTLLAFALKALAHALQRFPKVSASVDTENEQLILKRYYNIGVAVETPKGMLVPVIRDVDQKSVADLAVELPALAQRARGRKLALEEMRGAPSPSPTWAARASRPSKKPPRWPSWACRAASWSRSFATASSSRAASCPSACPTTTA